VASVCFVTVVKIRNAVARFSSLLMSGTSEFLVWWLEAVVHNVWLVNHNGLLHNLCLLVRRYSAQLPQGVVRDRGPLD
jgi:hypothetical protein